MFDRETHSRPVLPLRKLCAYIIAVMAACTNTPGDPTPDAAPPECTTPAVFDETGEYLRYEQLTKAAGDPIVRVALQPTDAGHILRVYPTTESDIWDDGGSVAFLGPNEEILFEQTGICTATFTMQGWRIPSTAVAVELGGITTEIVTARLLFTVAVEEN